MSERGADDSGSGSARRSLTPFAGLPAGRRQVHLLGFMGAGKSTVARLLARRWLWNYLDLDALVERLTGRSVAEVFASEGEQAFRRWEARALAAAVQKPNTVLALGGGTFVDAGNRELCRRAAVTVWLRVPFEVVVRRLGEADPRRPLYAESARVAALFAEREECYASADLVVDASGPAARVAREIERRIRSGG